MKKPSLLLTLFLLILSAMAISGCNSAPATSQTSGQDVAAVDDHDHHADEGEMLTLPVLAPLARNGNPLRVVATTSIIGDVVAQVGGDAIDLTVLIGPGVDPHSYQPAAQDLTKVENADVIFINGWGLEEALERNLTTIGARVVIVPISAGISPLEFGHHEGEEEVGHGQDHAGADPHVWFSVENVAQWVRNVKLVLSALAPEHAAVYSSNAATYLAQLEELAVFAKAELETIPADKRVLVTNHDAFAYFAHEYGFEVLGTVIPASSTLAEPSAADLAGLIAEMEAHGVCTLFTETTVNDTLARTVASELHCDEVKVLPLYSGALGPAGSGADTYLLMFRANIETIVEGLR